MNKQKKKKRGKKSVQNLLGLQGFTTYGLKTTGGELVYFAIQPTNISVLSHVNIEIKIWCGIKKVDSIFSRIS